MEEFIQNEAFEKNVNIGLCNSLINFIANTSDNFSNEKIDNIRKKCIWFTRKCLDDIQSTCNVEYFGELLERY